MGPTASLSTTLMRLADRAVRVVCLEHVVHHRNFGIRYRYRYRVRRGRPLLSRPRGAVDSGLAAVLAAVESVAVFVRVCVVELGQDQVVEITPNSVVVTELSGQIVKAKEYEISWDVSAAERGGFTHFMLKEIFTFSDTNY